MKNQNKIKNQNKTKRWVPSSSANSNKGNFGLRVFLLDSNGSSSDH